MQFIFRSRTATEQESPRMFHVSRSNFGEELLPDRSGHPKKLESNSQMAAKSACLFKAAASHSHSPGPGLNRKQHKLLNPRCRGCLVLCKLAPMQSAP